MPDQSRILEIEEGPEEGQFILRATHDYGSYSFTTYDAIKDEVIDNYVAQSGSSKALGTFKLKEGLYLHRDEDNLFNLRAKWRFIDIRKKKETQIEPNFFSLTDPFYRNDSTFIICSQEALNYSHFGYVLDSLPRAYLSYLDEKQGAYHFLDSLDYPMKQRFGTLIFDEKEKAWRITQDSLRFHFRKGQIIKTKVDSNLFFGRMSYYNRERRNLYLRAGRHRTFKDSSQSILHHFWYRESDTLEYTIPYEGSLVGQELFNLQGIGFIASLKPREDGYLDWMRYLPNNEIQMHRISPNGERESIQYFPQFNYPGYILYAMRSRPNGTFYLAGAGKRSVSQMKALLIKVDSNGVHDPPLGETIFQVHYNPEQDWLDLFYDKDDEKLWYQIWDMQAIMQHEGPVKSFEAMKLFRGSKGLHFVKLFSFDRQKYYGRRMFIRY